MSPLNRRKFLQLSGATASILSLGGCLERQKSSLSYGSKPNVLFIGVDDMNDWVGCLNGHPNAKTPNIDRLAQRGVLFERAYCAAPACLPSRTALMSGLAPHQTGIYTNSSGYWRDSPRLTNAVMLPQYFRQQGYWSGGTGKMYHSHGAMDADPPSWDAYWPSIDHAIAWSAAPPKEERPACGLDLPNRMDWGPVDVDNEEMGDWQSVNWAIEKLQLEHDKPFFLACGIFRPHLPWYVPRKYFDMHPLETVQLPQVKENDLDDIPEKWGHRMAFPTQYHPKIAGAGKWREAVQAYLACCSFADDCVGRLIEALDQSPYKDNTIVVLWSDHGWHLGEKHHWRKFTLWEESCRNPMIIATPDMQTAGGRVGEAVSLMDIYPTLVELCGLPPRRELFGKSLVKFLADPNVRRDEPVVVANGKENWSIRTSRWNYIYYRDRSEELYDHFNDPYEWTNLADSSQYKETKEWLRSFVPNQSIEDSGER